MEMLAPFIRWNDTPYGRIRAAVIGEHTFLPCNDIASAVAHACGRSLEEMKTIVLSVATGLSICERINCSTGREQTNGNPFNLIRTDCIAKLKTNALLGLPESADILDGIVAFNWIVTEDGHGR